MNKKTTLINVLNVCEDNLDVLTPGLYAITMSITSLRDSIEKDDSLSESTSIYSWNTNPKILAWKEQTIESLGTSTGKMFLSLLNWSFEPVFREKAHA